MDLLVRGKSPTEFSLKMTEIYLKTVISDLSASVSLLVKPDIAFQKNLNNLEGSSGKTSCNNYLKIVEILSYYLKLLILLTL